MRLKTGKLGCGDPPKVFSCTIGSLSESEARLGVSDPAGIADDIELIEASGKDHRAHVVWRAPGMLGVEFTDRTIPHPIDLNPSIVEGANATRHKKIWLWRRCLSWTLGRS